MSSDESRWDDGRAAALVGKRVLIGITYIGGRTPRQMQRHGNVLRATKGHAIDIAVGEAGEVFSLPPDTSVFQPAVPGEYRLRSTGEIVADPDYMVMYEVHEPSD